jgi:pimeloyl-ACP methyl ester carboxylesterase
MTNSRASRAIALAWMLSTAAAPAAAAQCTRGWTGTVQYTRSQANSSNKTVDRVSGKGTDTTNWTMTYDYVAQVAVREGPDPESSIGKANISLASVSTETRTAQDRQICPHERTPRAMSGNFVTQSKTSANASGLETDVSVTMDSDGTYSVGIRLPELKGKVSGSTSSSFSGQCTPRQGVNQVLEDSPYTIDPVVFSSSGDDRIQPSNPDRLTGSHSVSRYGVTETLRWNLRRCGAALRLVEVKLEDMRFPNWEDWKEIGEQTGTTDGNIVRIRAIVANDGPEEKRATIRFRDTYKGDKWDGARPDGLLEELSVAIPAGEQREVSFKWDSSGYAWYDDGRPRLVQRIKTEVAESSKKVDEQTRNLKVAPKPLVLVHGLWSNWRAWESWQNILTTSHSYDWKAYPVGEKAERGRMNTGEEMGNLGPTNTIEQNAEQLGRYIQYAQKERNAWHVDLVAHSMGGLISRRYIHAAMPRYADGKPQIAHLVMLGTPNMGSRCADLISAPLEFAGRKMEALRELRPGVVAEFNAATTDRKGVEFSVLAGNPLPNGCYSFTANDGVVTVPSAIWTISDNAQQSVLHTSMTGTEGFSSFVKPRVAIGPGGRKPAANPPAIKMLSDAARKGGGTGPAAAMSAGAQPPPGAVAAAPDLSRIVRLAPGEAMDVPLSVGEARDFGLTFIAANNVSATLIDDKGAILGANRAGTPEASQIFRSLFVGRPVAKGNWTLRLQNEGGSEREVVLSSWSNAS